ncbi:hypothetical protein PPL_08152 [Heterostelium album PN500]|uniref:B box-type domain-containing protein n=1 Tax=Heterostelium pallidum (strain ATCC 26659 / Pp 5 / PN500) TaxID=670386 RepID=D3BIR7_HETP5|nr:hypothetical protein PPL_08152 [Heterostelium album PN500]EFA78691.1 hypothetical protein PPL_08152 [Heterostelium album PN500]|eukprot:XP_020430815.1 hypothetical protein PPL_08152 [Heterostelium album PN500]
MNEYDDDDKDRFVVEDVVKGSSSSSNSRSNSRSNSGSNANGRIIRKKGGALGDWEGFVVKCAYTIVHLIIYLVLAVRSGTDLNVAFKERDYFYLIWTHSIFISTFIVFFIAASKSPGYSDDLPASPPNNNSNNRHINNNNNNNSNYINNNNSNNNSSSNKSKLKRSDDEFADDNDDHHRQSLEFDINSNNKDDEQIEEDYNVNKDNEMDQLLDSLESNNNKDKESGEDQPYCNICKRNVLIRSKHCKRCNRCILKYDHHCFFIGCCVGQYNHKSFCIFLVVQLVLLILGFQIALTGIHSAPTWKDWVLANLQTMNLCTLHNKELDVLCSDCNEIICYRCLISKHNQHRALHTEDINQSILDIDYSVVVSELDKDINNKTNDEKEAENKNKDNDTVVSTDSDNNKDKVNIIQKRIEWLWNKVKGTTKYIQKMTDIENHITDHFKQCYEMLMKEERAMKKPIIDELDEYKEKLHRLIKEIQSLYNIIQSITPTLIPNNDDHELRENHKNNNNKNNNDSNNGNNDYDILEDKSINYELPSIIESIKQSKSLDQFIHNNSNTIFSLHQQKNNEITEYINKNKIINMNKRHKNNDNTKSIDSNNKDNIILEILRKHFDNHKIKDYHLTNIGGSITSSDYRKKQCFFDGIKLFIQKSINVDFEEYEAVNLKYFITMDDDSVFSIYKCNFENGSQMELLEKESNQLREMLGGIDDSGSFIIGSSNSTIYIFSMISNHFIVYSIIDNTLREATYHLGFDLSFDGQPVTQYVDPFYLYFYGRSHDYTLSMIRFNTILEEFEVLRADEDARYIIPIALFSDSDFLESKSYSMYYDKTSHEICLVKYQMFSTQAISRHVIASEVFPRYVTYYFNGDNKVYLYYGDENSEYFLKIGFGRVILIENLATIEGLAMTDVPNELLILPTMIEVDETIYLFTTDKSFKYSLFSKDWEESPLTTTNIKYIHNIDKSYY